MRPSAAVATSPSCLRAASFYNHSTLIVAAGRTHCVCRNRLTALGAKHRLTSRLRIVRTATSLCGSWNVFSWEQPWQSLSAWGRHQACSRIHEFRSLPIVCQPNPRLFGSCGHTPIKSPGEQNVENTQLEPPTALFAARQPFATDRYQSSTPSRCMLPHKDRKSLRIVVSPACRIARRPGR